MPAIPILAACVVKKHDYTLSRKIQVAYTYILHMYIEHIYLLCYPFIFFGWLIIWNGNLDVIYMYVLMALKNLFIFIFCNKRW